MHCRRPGAGREEGKHGGVGGKRKKKKKEGGDTEYKAQSVGGKRHYPKPPLPPPKKGRKGYLDGDTSSVGFLLGGISPPREGSAMSNGIWAWGEGGGSWFFWSSRSCFKLGSGPSFFLCLYVSEIFLALASR